MLHVEEVKKLHDEMREIVLAAKISEKEYDIVPANLADFYIFLVNFRAEQYGYVKYIWELLPPSTWARYVMEDETKLREMILLRNGRKALRKAWRNYVKKNNAEHKRLKEASHGVGSNPKEGNSVSSGSGIQ